MTREEQIVEAGKTAAEGKEFSVLVNKQRRTMSAYEIGFIEGAEWADSHPAWVSVEDELPKENTAPIVRMDLTEKFGEETILYDVVAFDGNGFHTPYRVTHWKQIVPPAEKGGQDETAK